jgi:hypothetical protein
MREIDYKKDRYDKESLARISNVQGKVVQLKTNLSVTAKGKADRMAQQCKAE